MKVLKRKKAECIKYISVLVVCIFISGCDAKESAIISSPAISVSQGAAIGKGQKKEIKNSNWLPDGIVPLTASDWQKSVDENKRYIFILTGDKTIMQIDKKTKQSITVVQCKKNDIIYFLIAEEDYLYYQLNDNAICQYDLSTGNTKQIYYTENKQDSILGMQVYNNDIYLYMGGLIISKFDCKTKKQEKLLEGAVNPVFIDNVLFFRKKRNKITIYCLDLDTREKRVIRKSQNIKKKRFHDLFQYKGKFYYTVSGKQWQICEYSEKGKDKVILSLEPDKTWDFLDYPHYVYSRDKNSLYYVYAKGDNIYLSFYGNRANKGMKLPKDYLEKGCVCNGYFFYQGEKEEKYYYTYVKINDKK